MEYKISDSIKDTCLGEKAEKILSKCVHCGMCNATCPTYQLLGDELDGPRGRIYQVKQVLEGKPATRTTQQHLDRCLTCLSCETTCPSGVEYGELIEIGKSLIEDSISRPMHEVLIRKLLRSFLPYRKRFKFALRIGQTFRPVLPGKIKKSIPAYEVKPKLRVKEHARKMLILDGCVQGSLSPTINASTALVLDKLGISLVSAVRDGCCGAISLHMQEEKEAKMFMRKNIDAWWPYIEDGVEAIVSTASGCGTILEKYAEYLSDDPEYSDKAKRATDLVKDIAEIISTEDINKLQIKQSKTRVAFQSPCSLQHGLQIKGKVEAILKESGCEMLNIKDPHLCCGSAGTYSILQPDISESLKDQKIQNLTSVKPDIIATANIGCLHHLQSATEIPIKHWIEILSDRLST